jgi:PIN domain nuclease of toxin-antitoxin system
LGVLLDTHAWLWWASEPGRLSQRAIEAIESAETIGVSAISCWEVAMLVRKGRIALDREPATWIRQALARPGLLALSVSPPLAVDAGLLDAREFPGDPADRLIYATAKGEGLTLVTRDRRLREFDPRGTLW